MPHPTHDVLVVVPGMMGSTLWRNASPVWEPSGKAVLDVIRSAFRSVEALRLPEGIGDDHPGDGVEPRALWPDLRLPLGLWTFDLGYTRLLDFLRATFIVSEPDRTTPDRPANLITFPYDWRLSNRYNGRRLADTVEPVLERWRAQGGDHTEAQIVFICHSMGGLVARWYIDRLGGANHTRALITLGTPHRGALDALNQLCNGVRKGPGPFKVSLTAFARSLPSVHQLLPEYACIHHHDQLAKTTEIDVPDLDTTMAAHAMAFHTELDRARTGTPGGRRGTAEAYRLHTIVGIHQPTWTTARLEAGRVVTIRQIGERDERGDATVPRLAATPPDIPTDATIPYTAANHGGLVHNRAVYDQLEGILTANPVTYRGGDVDIAAEVDETLDWGQPLTIRAELPYREPIALDAVITDSQGTELAAIRLAAKGDGNYHAAWEPPAPGIYQTTIRGAGPARHRTNPIKSLHTVFPPDAELDLDH